MCSLVETVDLSNWKLSCTMQLAKLGGEDMNAVNNLEYIGVSVSKKSSSGFSLKFGGRKVKIWTCDCVPVTFEHGFFLVSATFPVKQ